MIDNNTSKVKSILNSVFDSVGIASKGNFDNAPEESKPTWMVVVPVPAVFRTVPEFVNCGTLESLG